jgi:hypothetical protein
MQPENPTLAKLPLTLAALIDEALGAWADQFDGDPSTDISINGGDLLDWFADWRQRMREAITNPEPDLAKRLFVIVEGGLVSGVVTDDPALVGLDVGIIDYDTDDIDDEEREQLVTFDQKHGEAQAFVRGDTVERAEFDLTPAHAELVP